MVWGVVGGAFVVVAAGCSWLAEVVKWKFFGEGLVVFVAAGCYCLAGVVVNFLFELGLSDYVVQPSYYFVIGVVAGVREVGCGSVNLLEVGFYRSDTISG